MMKLTQRYGMKLLWGWEPPVEEIACAAKFRAVKSVLYRSPWATAGMEPAGDFEVAAALLANTGCV